MSDIKLGLGGMVVCLVLLAAMCGCDYKYFGPGTEETLVVQMQAKERVTGSDSSTYLVWTDIISRDGKKHADYLGEEVFSIEDSMWYGNFRSSDWYGNFHEDNCYEIDVIGRRIGFWSMYRNVVNYKEVDCPVG